MSLHVYTEFAQGTEEWHDARRGMVTASAVSKLLTPTLKVADNETSRGLTALLVAERITGHTDPTWQSDDMLRGVECEPLARDKYAETEGVAVTEVGFMTRDDWGFTIGLSPDGLVGEDGLIEVKAPRAKTHIRTVLADQVPADYMAQVQCALLVSGRAWCDFISYSGGLPMWHKRVTPDPDWHAAIVEAVREFEQRAEQMASDFLTKTADLPATERYDLDLVI